MFEANCFCRTFCQSALNVDLGGESESKSYDIYYCLYRCGEVYWRFVRGSNYEVNATYVLLLLLFFWYFDITVPFRYRWEQQWESERHIERVRKIEKELRTLNIFYYLHLYRVARLSLTITTITHTSWLQDRSILLVIEHNYDDSSLSTLSAYP